MGIQEKNYFLASLHRQENVDYLNSLENLIVNLNSLVKEYDLPLILSVHPRTKKNLTRTEIKLDKRIILSKPFGFFDYTFLQLNSFCNIKDLF